LLRLVLSAAASQPASIRRKVSQNQQGDSMEQVVCAIGALLACELKAARAAIATGRAPPMLRISESTMAVATILHLEGKLLGPWAREVQEAVRAARSRGPVRLDLAGLSFADATGIELLRNLQATGVETTGGSPFIQGLLSGPGGGRA
jgi:ABC-type transporter Mla MlaB component